jgi:hypothetical protein
MKQFLLLALFCLLSLGAFNSCEEQEAVEPLTLTAGQTTQSVFADQEKASGTVSFTTAGAWTSSVAETTRATSWVTVSPSSGNAAGDYTITITLEPNYTGSDRTATVTIASGGEELEIAVTQKATTQTGEVPIDPEMDVLTKIPDPAFLEYCLSMMPEWDTNSDGLLSVTEAVAVNVVIVEGEYNYQTLSPIGEIASLEGIEYFTGLTILICSSNQLTSLDVSKNTALTSLICSSNQLTALDISKNTALTTLYCDSNQLTTLDLSKNTVLTDLWCFSNQLTTLDLSKNTVLTDLWCSYNRLTALDVSKNTALTTLDCSSNQLTALDISKNTALTTLHCSSNQLTALDISKNTALTTLYCDSNQLTALDISKNTALAYLYCRDNPGDGVSILSVKAWFNNSLTPIGYFTNGSWSWNGNTIAPYYYTDEGGNEVGGGDEIVLWTGNVNAIMFPASLFVEIEAGNKLKVHIENDNIFENGGSVQSGNFSSYIMNFDRGYAESFSEKVMTQPAVEIIKAFGIFFAGDIGLKVTKLSIIK